MEKEFITYELAVELKKIGFDEPCFGEYKELECYDYKGGCGVKIAKSIFLSTINGVRNYNQENLISAPLYQQAFRWFREKYGIVGYCYIPNESGYWGHSFEKKAKYYTYEEAQLECLKKLIEIVRTNNI